MLPLAALSAVLSACAAPLPSPEHPPRATIEVTIIDTAGRPVAGALLDLRRDESRFGSWPQPGASLSLARTGVDGRASFDIADDGGWYLLRVSHPAHATTWSYPIDSFDAATLSRTVVLSQGGRARLKVTDEAGVAIPDAEVTVRNVGPFQILLNPRGRNFSKKVDLREGDRVEVDF
jgi:hypothetical protein